MINTRSVVQTRRTKYCDAIIQALQDYGHATNLELLSLLRLRYPELSATTIHRITSRLSERQVIGAAPMTSDGNMRFDANNQPHDHFRCSSCDRLMDINVSNDLIPLLKNVTKYDCIISGPLTISGSCEACINNKESIV